MRKTIRLGTRGSALALIQAEKIKQKLLESWDPLGDETEIEIVPISTSGDWRADHVEQSFVELGGNKDRFTKEIDDALSSGHIDMAVHSVKDLASTLTAGIRLSATLARDDARDAFISRSAASLNTLPEGATIGTSSLRRQAQILAERPDLRMIPLRGNVDTRLEKLKNGMADATILAVAGLIRLQVENRITAILSASTMLPAAGQGALGVLIREQDEAMDELLAPLDDGTTRICVTAERAVMRAIDGDCTTPAAAFATITGSGLLALEALVARADGSDLVRLAATGDVRQAEAIGDMLGEKLRKRAPADLFSNE